MVPLTGQAQTPVMSETGTEDADELGDTAETNPTEGAVQEAAEKVRADR